MNYENYERAQGWSDQPFGSCNEGQAAYFDAELRPLALKSALPLRALDIGFGNGSFMAWARKQGWQCDGIEVNPVMVERAVASGFLATEGLPSLQALSGWQPYDLITGFDVLEHIDREALVGFLSSLRAACRPSTLLVFRFPNGDNPFSLPVQNGDVTHKTAIGQGMLRQLAELAAFDVAFLGEPRQPLAGQSRGRRLAVMAGVPLRNAIGFVIRRLFMGSMSVVFTGNLVAVLKPRQL